MKIAYFHTDTILSSWSVWAAARTLRKMGHSVLDARIPTDSHGTVVLKVLQSELDHIAQQMPKLADLEDCDRVVVQGPEFVTPWLNTLYGDDWDKLPVKRVAMMLESSRRADIQLPMADVAKRFDVCFAGDPQDIEQFWWRRMRPGVDIAVFRPEIEPKVYDTGFVGTLYQSRFEFLQKLLPLIDGIEFAARPVAASDVGGECHELWTELYVRSIRRLRIHVALPSNNPMPVGRAFETLACGTFLLNWGELPEPLVEGQHYRRYGSPEELAELIRYYLEHAQERERIAYAGCAVVREHFTLEQQWAEVLSA